MNCEQVVKKLESCCPGGEVNASYRAGYHKACEVLREILDNEITQEKKNDAL